MPQIDSFHALIEPGQRAIAVHHKLEDGSIKRLHIEGGQGTSGKWQTNPDGIDLIIVFRQTGPGRHDVLMGKLPARQKLPTRNGEGFRKKWTYAFNQLRKRGETDVNWQQFTGQGIQHGSTVVHNDRTDLAQKGVFLKPLKLNRNGYVCPDGTAAGGKFPGENGFGFEEWMNADSSVCDGFRHFHAKAAEQGELVDFGRSGSLGMVFMVSHDGVQEAVGMAMGVSHVPQTERRRVARRLRFKSRSREAWALPSVRDRLSKEEFDAMWEDNYDCQNWKCPTDYFLWFDEPVKLDPLEISGAPRLNNRFGSHQHLHPQHVLDLLKKAKRSHPAIEAWLLNGDIAIPKGVEREGQTGRAWQKSRRGTGGNASARDAYFRMLTEKSQCIEPLHTELQSEYAEFIKNQKGGLSVSQNDNYVDVILRHQKYQWLVEVKPTIQVKSRYAIRAAIGQLLEYRFHSEKKKQATMDLIIVLSARPEEQKEINFVHSLGIGLAWRDGGDFVHSLPPGWSGYFPAVRLA